MNEQSDRFTLEITKTGKNCPTGEIAGNRYQEEGKIPVLSCEGPCIRGEIARLAAHLVAREEPFRRGCHGELITVPGSAIAQWIKTAERIVLIDGCFLRCHGRVLENLIDANKMAQFNAHSFYRKFNEHFDIDEVPEAERQAAARQVADAVLAELKQSTAGTATGAAACGAAAVVTPGRGCGCS